MNFERYTYKESLPLWRGGGFNCIKKYKNIVNESYFGIDCNLIYHSNDGVNISYINIHIPSLFIKETLQPNTNIENFVKGCFLNFINKSLDNELFLTTYNRAKKRYSDLYEVYICSIDVSFECQRFFSNMIYKDFGKIIV